MGRLKELLGDKREPDRTYEFSFKPKDDNDSETTDDDFDSTKAHNEKEDIPKEKLRVVATKSATTNGREITVTTLDLIDYEGKSLGKIRIGYFTGVLEKSKTQDSSIFQDKDGAASSEYYPTVSFTDDNGQKTWAINSNDGHKYVLQGDEKVLEKALALFANSMLTFSEGLVDDFTLGLTKKARNFFGVDHGIDENSFLYRFGGAVGYLVAGRKPPLYAQKPIK